MRVTEELPKLASMKLDKTLLRREAWNAPNAYWRPQRGAALRPLTHDDARASTTSSRRRHSRGNSLPSSEVLMDFRPFDFDNHYYEVPDAFTRYLDRSFANRGVRWAEIDGRRRLLVAGTVNNYVANPTFDPVSRPGALFDWYRGNPEQVGIREAFGELEPLRPEYHDRERACKPSTRRVWAG